MALPLRYHHQIHPKRAIPKWNRTLLGSNPTKKQWRRKQRPIQSTITCNQSMVKETTLNMTQRKTPYHSLQKKRVDSTHHGRNWLKSNVLEKIQLPVSKVKTFWDVENWRKTNAHKSWWTLFKVKLALEESQRRFYMKSCGSSQVLLSQQENGSPTLYQVSRKFPLCQFGSVCLTCLQNSTTIDSGKDWEKD